MLEAVVLAGGLGTRLRSVTGDVPKPMAPVAGRPFLEHLLDLLAAHGVSRVVLSVGYRREVIARHFGSEYGGLRIAYAVEEDPLGTGGAVARALAFVRGDSAIVLNGDSYFAINLTTLADLYLRDGAGRLVMALRRIEDAERYGSCRVEGGVVTGFVPKGQKGPALINSGVYVVPRDVFAGLDLPDRFSLEVDFLEKRVVDLKPLAFVSQAPFIDIGIPEAYLEAQELFRSAPRST